MRCRILSAIWEGVSSYTTLALNECWPYMLVYQYNSDVLAVFCESVECGFDGCILGLVVDNEEVLFGIGASRDVL